MHTFLAERLTAALRPDELLRAEWVARVSALDLYVHELVAQKMLATFEGVQPTAIGFGKFSIPNDVLMRIRAASSEANAAAAFDLEVRTRLGYSTYQDPDKIADGIRMISNCELWNEIAMRLGATPATKTERAKAIKRSLSLIVERRNKIAHEGDLQPGIPRDPWPITKNDLRDVAQVILDVVNSIEQVV
ncbi:HEPN domain-containing protein [Burkholderia contaminans]|uniref:HEPN domain-containing protein n=1 Tax=Burkholderia contaminans TaxID=488447 RepID=UPI0031106D1E